MNCFNTYRAKIVESTLKRGVWKVWIIQPHAAGWMRGGFAWRTRTGAEQAAIRTYPGIQLIS